MHHAIPPVHLWSDNDLLELSCQLAGLERGSSLSTSDLEHLLQHPIGEAAASTAYFAGSVFAVNEIFMNATIGAVVGTINEILNKVSFHTAPAWFRLVEASMFGRRRHHILRARVRILERDRELVLEGCQRLRLLPDRFDPACTVAIIQYPHRDGSAVLVGPLDDGGVMQERITLSLNDAFRCREVARLPTLVT